MILEKDNIKRYGIYVFFDKDGVVDKYNYFFLKEFRKKIDNLLIICNGEIEKDGEEEFRKISDEFIKRPNEGFDVTSYKLGIQLKGYEFLNNFDEVLIFNSTVFGPLYPLNEMFDSMSTKDIDFWGITSFNATDFDPFGTIKYKYIPEHIQSYFMVFRRSLFDTDDFRKFFDTLPKIKNYQEAIGFFEAIFTKHFSDLGYKWSVYCSAEELIDYTYDPLRDYPKKLIEEKRCPIIKRRSFFHDYAEAIDRSCGEATIEAYEYIKKNLEYDLDMIWENILRIENMADIYKRMHLNYVLPTQISKSINKSRKIALILHIHYMDLAEECLNYISNMPEEADIYVTVGSNEKKQFIEKTFSELKCNKLEVIIVENRGRDVSALLIGTREFIQEYDLVCFLHDKKVTQLFPGSIGAGWAYRSFENLLSTKDFVNNIINKFEENDRLGMLTQIPPNHALYYPTIGKYEWGPNFKNAKKIARELELKTNMDETKEPIAPFGSYFWFRPKAVKKLFEKQWKYEDFPKEPLGSDGTISHAIERVYPFVVQDAGFYTATVLSDRFAKIELTNMQFILDEINGAIKEKTGNGKYLWMLSMLDK